MKRIFMIDWGLLPSFILSVYTGIELHVAGHGNNHEIWHDWAIFHVITTRANTIDRHNVTLFFFPTPRLAIPLYQFL